MRPAVILLVPCLFLVAEASPARAACERAAPWSRVGDSLEMYATPLPLALSAGSVLPLVTFVPTGLDHDLRLVAQEDLGGRYALESVSLYAPYVLAGGLVAGVALTAVTGVCEAQKPQAAMLQAMTGGLLVTALLKWSVGRVWPNAGGDPYSAERLSQPENAENFAPFGDDFGAWPSGHTLSMFAAASALRASLPHAGWLRFLGYPVAAGVGVGMWINDRHWASDVLSGAMLGEAVGSSVGEAFGAEERTWENAVENGRWSVLPLPGGALVLFTSGEF